LGGLGFVDLGRAYIDVPRLQQRSVKFGFMACMSLLDFALLQAVHIDVNAIFGKLS